MIADVSTAADVESLAVRHARGWCYMTDLLTVILGNRPVFSLIVPPLKSHLFLVDSTVFQSNA